MSYYALWMDHSHATLFQFLPGETKVTHLKNNHHSNHHSNHQGNEKSENLKKYYKDLRNDIAAAKEILLLGPGMAKNEFKSYLETHNDAKIAQAIVAIENVGKATEGEIQNIAKKFFHKYNLFN